MKNITTSYAEQKYLTKWQLLSWLRITSPFYETMYSNRQTSKIQSRSLNKPIIPVVLILLLFFHLRIRLRNDIFF
jgi:hypothetical protein